jgi:PIN domain nuclease of toxin-antitoxin system
MAGEQDRIGEKAKQAIAGNDVLVSAVVIWEVAIKRHLGKLDAPADLLDKLEEVGVNLLPITPRHADRVGTLPPHHRDPFDRLLIAQADCDGLVLATADKDLHRYEVETIW